MSAQLSDSQRPKTSPPWAEVVSFAWRWDSQLLSPVPLLALGPLVYSFTPHPQFHLFLVTGVLHLLVSLILRLLFDFRQSWFLHPSHLSSNATSLRKGSADNLLPGGENIPPPQLGRLN